MIILILGSFCAVLYGICMVANVVLFGQITGAFATESFSGYCHLHQQQNSSMTSVENKICPMGIELNPYNYDKLHM
jgi:hypothetical protein